MDKIHGVNQAPPVADLPGYSSGLAYRLHSKEGTLDTAYKARGLNPYLLT